ncbi:alpha/beta hydrolase [Demequina mangrovi]|uniref:Alpha/beta hydrolase family protein n=1 Tax=Demequina mangrovi TaxID=1043493 RepID=A0A1H6YZM1_9MICO|nr:alpha/beta hydrolase [Demequina mangrovi]SEJ46689.1 Alpha/beta hydrolase family protein [Demequina mangrovi]
MTEPASPDAPRTSPAWEAWTIRGVAALALVVAVVLATLAWGAVVHGHPAYAVMLAVTVLLAAITLWRWRRARRAGGAALLGLRVLGIFATLAWVALIAWLKPFTATEPALSAMKSDGAVSVTESATQIVMRPTGETSGVALAFQPGARVDPRAYAAVLRPLVEAGHPVVVTKQPLGIAFLAMGGFEQAKATVLEAGTWVVGGHSLGGTVAAIEADTEYPTDQSGPAGLLLYGSYPAGDMTSYEGAVLSVSGSEDGLATPADIEASRADLPDDALYWVVEGGSHAQFGAYGDQPGDGEPTVTDDEAREQIAAASLAFLDGPLEG